MVLGSCPSLHCHLYVYISSFIKMPKVVLKLFARQGTDRGTDVPTLHIVSYLAGTDAFMSLQKPI